MDKPLHYEIHVTVKTEEVNRFMDECGAIGVKPIVLDLQKQDGGSIQDVMTSSKLTGDDNDAWTRMKEISWYLQAKGFNVVREKIETVPWHPKAVVHDENSKEGYFETHIPVLVNPTYLDALKGIAERFNLHMSRNPFKVNEDGNFLQRLTLRESTDLEDFQLSVSEAMNELHYHDFLAVTKFAEVEYALYDSNVNHDASWIGQKSQSLLV